MRFRCHLKSVGWLGWTSKGSIMARISLWHWRMVKSGYTTRRIWLIYFRQMTHLLEYCLALLEERKVVLYSITNQEGFKQRCFKDKLSSQSPQSSQVHHQSKIYLWKSHKRLICLWTSLNVNVSMAKRCINSFKKIFACLGLKQRRPILAYSGMVLHLWHMLKALKSNLPLM